jgi:DcmR-like sensory protein
MNATGEAILTHPHPCGHFVYPYTNESQFVDAVSLFVSAGLRNGDSAILIMEQPHHEPIRCQLLDNGFELSELESTGRLAFEGAEALLSTFLFDGIIDEYKFKQRVASLIEKAKTVSSTGQVRVMGEMVNLTAIENPQATQRLEELWNDVIKVHSVSLLCAYALGGTRPDALPESLIACHSESLA